MTMNGVYAMSAVTALTAQNTTGVQGIFPVTPEFLGQQLDSICSDLPVHAVKIGMVANDSLIKVIAEKLRFYHLGHIVVDPLMVSTSGSALLQASAVSALASELFPLAELITPNIPEAQALSRLHIKTAADMCAAAASIYEIYHCPVLLKGGHSIQNADDLLYDGQIHWFRGTRIDNPNTHGTGCTLSSAIAANLAKDMPLVEAIRHAKAYLTNALNANLDLGSGSGPLMHNYSLVGEGKASK
jgi:hydroxymethylpyrimidine/phosphomethylpyrimidine kinase